VNVAVTLWKIAILLHSFGERGKLLAILVPMHGGFLLMVQMTVNCQLHSTVAELISHYGISNVCMY